MPVAAHWRREKKGGPMKLEKVNNSLSTTHAAPTPLCGDRWERANGILALFRSGVKRAVSLAKGGFSKIGHIVRAMTGTRQCKACNGQCSDVDSILISEFSNFRRLP